MKSLQNTVAVIAGASKGIGAAVAVALAREGCDLALIARNEAGLEKTADLVRQAGRQALVCPTDLSNSESVQTAANKIGETYKQVDVLYNGVAGGLEKNIFDAQPAQVDLFIRTTLTGSIWLTHAMMPLMNPTESHVINMISDWALPRTSSPSTYVAGKYGLLGFGWALSKEALPKGVRVTNILPGDIASRLTLDDGPELAAEKFGTSKIPLIDFVNVVLLILKLQVAKIDYLIMTPSDPNY
jgi:NAD(P)-dependent dehydrogenase (short-subunit alcohol dehydrogenase family)